MGSFASAQSTANALTKATQLVAAAFFATSLILAILAAHRGTPTSILDSASPAAITKEVPADKAPVSKKDEPKKAPAVPIGQ
jgi:preprotein translocase subunit SecG